MNPAKPPRFSGPAGRGATRELRKAKRHAASVRNLVAAEDTRRWHRQLAALDDEQRTAILLARGSAYKVADWFAGEYGVRLSPTTVKVLRQQAQGGDGGG